jgi:three-Cys-motif partner protein
MHKYLKPEEDGLAVRPSGAWAIKKLDYLRRYIDIFVTSMHNKPWRALNYIDLFAGPGKCRVRSNSEIFLGSPLIALKATYPFSGYYFGDLEPGNITTLQKRCSVSPVAEQVNYCVGDSNKTVRRIVDHISKIDREFIRGQWPSLNLAFLDPTGIDLHWETVKRLAQINRMDLIIHYSQMGLSRLMPNVFDSTEENRIDSFFGDREWRDIYREWQGKIGLHRQLIDHYKNKLCNLGYADIRGLIPEPLMRSKKKKAPLYRLIFASKHELAHDFWRKTTSRDVYGQHRLF